MERDSYLEKTSQSLREKAKTRVHRGSHYLEKPSLGLRSFFTRGSCIELSVWICGPYWVLAILYIAQRSTQRHGGTAVVTKRWFKQEANPWKIQKWMCFEFRELNSLECGYFYLNENMLLFLRCHSPGMSTGKQPHLFRNVTCTDLA